MATIRSLIRSERQIARPIEQEGYKWQQRLDSIALCDVYTLLRACRFVPKIYSLISMYDKTPFGIDVFPSLFTDITEVESTTISFGTVHGIVSLFH